MVFQAGGGSQRYQSMGSGAASASSFVVIHRGIFAMQVCHYDNTSLGGWVYFWVKHNVNSSIFHVLLQPLSSSMSGHFNNP